jgi:hypothetical protein
MPTAYLPEQLQKQILKDKQFRNKLAGIKKIISKS